MSRGRTILHSRTRSMTLTFSLKNVLPLLALVLAAASIVAPRFLNVIRGELPGGVRHRAVRFPALRDGAAYGRRGPAGLTIRSSRGPKTLTARPSDDHDPAGDLDRHHRSPRISARSEDARHRHQQRERGHRGGGMPRQEMAPDPRTRRSWSDRRDRRRPPARPRSRRVQGGQDLRSGPSTTRERPRSGSGATRLDQTTKPSMSMRPARLRHDVGDAPGRGGGHRHQERPGPLPLRRGQAIRTRPRQATTPPSIWCGPGRSPITRAANRIVKKTCACITSGGEARGHAEADGGKQQAELRDPEEEPVAEDQAPGDVRGRARRTPPGRPRRRSAGRTSSRGGVVPDPDLDDDEAEAPEEGDQKGQEAVAQGHGRSGPYSDPSRPVREPVRRRVGASGGFAAQPHDDLDAGHFHAGRAARAARSR